ncbi:hypothetical protein [Deinococcus cellulosilyticus]|uniref:Uncharacterized protein n=1 Tax=Deinococcus cellulosilyticus (strain DSM 18568 / NBRC 106333 / KACC 11606 / 5516J-15) TaxID=1223518 RepID=A0A511N476_DEIC1|nr:hypothetical protein [Deinococcus cellulosilyticus]GEM47181.1 hypothetical protein DC3_28160 [Deinococcus cellulosilyticus NBRC 106333 = KACC 11606]
MPYISEQGWNQIMAAVEKDMPSAKQEAGLPLHTLHSRCEMVTEHLHHGCTLQVDAGTVTVFEDGEPLFTVPEVFMEDVDTAIQVVNSMITVYFEAWSDAYQEGYTAAIEDRDGAA